MAVPRVFISSTYYDLKYVRDQIREFIIGLGYDPVLHDKGGVAYSQSQTLEQSCYDELATCDIVVCIIGNKYGTQSAGSDYSITMEELLNAIRLKKKIYIFISNDVFLENNIYSKNKDSGKFVPTYADDIRIHEFISEIKKHVKNNPIMSFNSVPEILELLKNQLSGLFQHLLVQEASITESKTLYDLDSITKKIDGLIDSYSAEQTEFFQKFNGTFLVNNRLLLFIKKKLGMDKSAFFTDSLKGLDEFLFLVGFTKENDLDFPPYTYIKANGNRQIKLTIKEEAVNPDETLKTIYNLSEVENYVSWEEQEIESNNDLPF